MTGEAPFERPPHGAPSVAIVHDYLTQRGGAERVVLAMHGAFPSSPILTSLFDADATFPEFSAAGVDLRPSWLQRAPLLREKHRLAFPLLAPTFGRLHVDADVTIASSSGWAHGARTTGAVVVYCYAPARWLYQTERYLDGAPAWAPTAFRPAASVLRRWDQRAMARADRILTSSRLIAAQIAEVYGRQAEILPPPTTLDPDGPARRPKGLFPGVLHSDDPFPDDPFPGEQHSDVTVAASDRAVAAPADRAVGPPASRSRHDGSVSDHPPADPPFVLCVSRLLAYKNVDLVLDAMRLLPHLQLVIVGDGPHAERLLGAAGPNVVLLGRVDDAELRWLYAHAEALVAVAHEDFGLTPIEANLFGTPAVAWRGAGYLDTVNEGVSGCFVDRLDPKDLAAGIDACVDRAWDRKTIRAHAAAFGIARFTDRLHELVAELT